MFHDDESARRALRPLADEPAPPVATSLDQVLRRGRRRVLAQRAGAVASVVATVAAIGVATVLLRPAEQGGAEVATSPAPTTTSTGPLPGWQYAERADDCRWPTEPRPPVAGAALLPEDVVKPAFTSAVQAVTGRAPEYVKSTWQTHSGKVDGPRGYMYAEVGMDNGNGQIQLEAVMFGGTPRQAADASRNAYGSCEQPTRRVLGDGTIMQLYRVNDFHLEQPTQPLQIYRPDGRMYVLTAAGFGDADVAHIGGGTGGPVVGGRGKLPVAQAQLAQLAELLVVKLR